jgi:glycosyltransferase involved in cell wall biosynthesis
VPGRSRSLARASNPPRGASLMAGTGISLGLPIHNGARHLCQALDSLLAQSYRDFNLVLLDDGSVDGSDSIAQEYARRDPRICFFRHGARTGLVNAWKRVADIAARSHAPSYFAWFSDHDWVAPDWLERLSEALQEQPDAVLAHARTIHVDADGSPTGAESYALDTAKMEPYEQLRAVSLGPFGAGDAVYGLFRFDALRRCGIFPQEILPDRLLVSELTLFGTVAHVPGAVRFRRVFAASDSSADVIRRQLSTLFAPSDQPVRPHLSHATYFIRRLLHAPADEPPRRRMQRLYHALLYFQRQFNKYRLECVRELERPEPLGEIAPLTDFLGAVLERKWKFLYQDYAGLLEKTRNARVRVRELKALRESLEEKIAELEARNAEAQARNAEAQARNAEAQARNAEAEARNAEAEARIAMLSEELRHPVRHLLRRAAKTLRR